MFTLDVNCLHIFSLNNIQVVIVGWELIQKHEFCILVVRNEKWLLLHINNIQAGVFEVDNVGTDFKIPYQLIEYFWLTHCGRETHIFVSKVTTIGSDNGLWPSRRQASIWTSAGTLLIGTLGTNFNEIYIEIHIFSFNEISLKMSSENGSHFVGPNVLNQIYIHCDFDTFGLLCTIVYMCCV